MEYLMEKQMEKENKESKNTQPKVEEIVSHETSEVKTPETKPETITMTKDEFAEKLQERVARDRGVMYSKLGVDDIDEAIQAVKEKKDMQEKQKIQKGEFEEILKSKTQEWNKEKTQLENQLKDIKINKAILQSASKHKAINPEQVVSLLEKNIKLNDSGNVEVTDNNGVTRYNDKGELFNTDDLVKEFLNTNPHFVSATPSGSGSVSNVDRSGRHKDLNLAELNFNNPEDKKLYAAYRRQRDSKPTVINLKNN